MFRIILSALAGLSLLSCTEKVCTQKGCHDGVTLDYSETPLDDMAYEFEVASPDGMSTCHLEPDGPNSYQTGCEGDLQLTVGPTSLTVYGTPSQVSVTVMADDDMKGHVSVQPGYGNFYPNGEQCDEVPCRVDTIPVQFTAP